MQVVQGILCDSLCAEYRHVTRDWGCPSPVPHAPHWSAPDRRSAAVIVPRSTADLNITQPAFGRLFPQWGQRKLADIWTGRRHLPSLDLDLLLYPFD
jgi:hypothetical protein